MGWTDYLPGNNTGIPNLSNPYAGGQWAAGQAGVDPNNLLGQFALPSQYPDRQQILDQATKGMNQAAPTVDQSQSNYWRGLQQNQANQLMGIASGQRQGAGELAAQRQAANAQAAQQAQANMARGGANSGLAYRQAARNQAGIGLAGAGQAQQAALQDQQMAQGQLMGLTQGARGQDQANAFANQQANLGQQQIGLGYTNSLSGMDANQLNAAVAAKQSQNALFGGLLSQGGMMLASDENLKTDISPANKEIGEFLDGLDPKRYRYKDEKHGKGSRVGIMAQDAERSKAGRDIVRNTTEGKMLDVNATISALLASSAHLHKRLQKVER